MGSLLTPEFIKKSRPTGYYTIEELRTATSWDTVDTMLPILESLGLCAKVSTTHSLIRRGSDGFFLYKVAPPELKISPILYFVIHNSVMLSKILKIIVLLKKITL